MNTRRLEMHLLYFMLKIMGSLGYMECKHGMSASSEMCQTNIEIRRKICLVANEQKHLALKNQLITGNP